MNHWSEYPFVRILFAFLAGLLTCIFSPVHFPDWLLPVMVLLVLFIHISSRSKTIRLYKYAAFIGCIFQLTAFVFGNVLTHHKIDQHDSDQFVYKSPKAGFFVVKITEPPIEKEKTYKILVSVSQAVDSVSATPTFGRSILYLKKDSASAHLHYGDLLMVRNNFQSVAQPSNPDQFDYKKYLWYREIYATAFLNREDWHLLTGKSVNPLFQFTFLLRDFSIKALQNYIHSEREAAVAEALVIGFRDHMSMETTQSYTAAGVVHVLAVSGLHVAIVFALLHQLLFFLNRKKHGKLIQAIIILAAIWIFTMVTGLSGSVVRASTMFSFITIGKNMKRPVNLFNILACSAMVILLIDPLLVMDVGFQLSYLAVLGIGTLNNYIDRWLPRENKIVDYLWKMVAMSLAAQIATLPLTTYYFHQFPAYFLFANIVVIPIAGILLYLGITLIALQFISPLASLLGKAINLITYLMNEFIEHIQKLPAASIHLPEISLLQLLLFGAVIILISRFFITGAKKLFFAGMICTLLFITFHCVNVCELLQQKTFTVYDFRKAGVLEFRSGNSAELYKCAGIISTQDSAYLEQHWRLSNIVPIVNADQKTDFKKKLHPQFSNCCSFVQFYNYRLAIVNSPFQVQPKTKKIKVNALLISGNPSLHLKDVLPYFETAHIIFDTSNSPYHVNKWKEEASQLGFAIHDVATEGAFVQHI